jgi:hypothetical protein
MAEGYASSVPATTVVPATQAVPAVRAATASGYIVAPLYDSIFFILSPLIALGLGVLIYYNHISSIQISWNFLELMG